jgi:putative addiction module component (TIGR02574 family)
MSVAPEALLEQALALSPEDRARLASGLLASLDDEGTDEAEVERLWSEETERRASQIASGEVELITWEQVIERVGGSRRSSSPE